jgi:hypothetical protein
LTELSRYIAKHKTNVTSWHGLTSFGIYLAESETSNVDKHFVELGVHKGDSYFSFCQGISYTSPIRKCFAIDTWKGDAHAGYYGDDVFDLVSDENKKYGFSSLIREDFDTASNQFDSKSIQILHIDGLHTYEAVKHDFETWFPKVSQDGIILMHDTQVPESSGFGVGRFFNELKNSFDTAEFKHSHGLGMILLGNTDKWCNILENRPSECSQHCELNIRDFCEERCVPDE